jgi:hypothetical protein
LGQRWRSGDLDHSRERALPVDTVVMAIRFIVAWRTLGMATCMAAACSVARADVTVFDSLRGSFIQSLAGVDRSGRVIGNTMGERNQAIALPIDGGAPELLFPDSAASVVVAMSSSGELAGRVWRGPGWADMVSFRLHDGTVLPTAEDFSPAAIDGAGNLYGRLSVREANLSWTSYAASYASGVATKLFDEPDSNSHVQQASSNGNVLIYVTRYPDRSPPVTWSRVRINGMWSDLIAPGFDYFSAQYVNDLGQVIGFANNESDLENVVVLTRTPEGAWGTLAGMPAGEEVGAAKHNDRGGVMATTQAGRILVWDRLDSTSPIDLTDAIEASCSPGDQAFPTFFNDAGQIGGSIGDETSSILTRNHAFVYTPAPEPSLIVFVSGTAALCLRRLRVNAVRE